MKVVIFANGKEQCSAAAADRAKSADLIIAADGGAIHCEKLGVFPDVLVGDCDSIPVSVLERYEANHIEILRHPVKKDATDLELALEVALARDAESIDLFGALGGRWDMSLANIFLAGAAKFRRLNITFFGIDCIIHVLHSGRMQRLNNCLNATVTLLPLFARVSGVTLHGFEYPLKGAELISGSTRGVSNVITENSATISHSNGVLLCILSGC